MPRFVSTPKKGHGRSRLYERARKRVLARSQVCWVCSGAAAHAEYAPFSHPNGELPFGSAAIDMTLAWPHPGSASVDHEYPVSMLGPDDPRLWSEDFLHSCHLGCNSKRGNGARGPTAIATRVSRNWLA